MSIVTNRPLVSAKPAPFQLPKIARKRFRSTQVFGFMLWLCLPFLWHSAIGQANPGNVGTANLTAWFEPGGLTTVSVVNWTTIIPSGFNAITVNDPSPPYATSTTTPPGDVSNYNMTVDFSGNTFAAQMGLQNSNSMNLLNNVSSGGQGTFFGAYLLTGPSPNGHMLMYNEPSGDGIQFRSLPPISRIAIGQAGGSSNATRDYAEEYQPAITSYTGNRSTATSMTAYHKSLAFTSSGVSGSTGPRGLTFGIRPGVNPSAFTGYLHEFIFYNRDLTGPELARVHTYLAIKYGVTLKNNGGGSQGDYIATNGDIIWNASVMPAYHNDIMGLSRDDNEGLLQKQSHSYDDTSRIYLSTLAADNISNTGSFTSNFQSLVAGHNQGAMCETALSSTEMPPSVNHRLEREWRVTNTNFNGTFSFDFKLAGCSSCLDDPNDLRLLVDGNANFSNALVFAPGGGLGISANNGVVTVSGISNVHIPINTARYITLGTVNPCVLNTHQVPLYAMAMEHGSVRLSWEAPIESDINSFFVERADQNNTWKTLQSIPTTSQAYQYEYYDHLPYQGDSYYRLKYTDANGSINYSNVEQVWLNKRRLSISPNPTSGLVAIQGENLKKEAFQLFNIQGQNITNQAQIRVLNEFNIEINLERIPAGVIFLRTPSTIRKIIKTE